MPFVLERGGRSSTASEGVCGEGELAVHAVDLCGMHLYDTWLDSAENTRAQVAGAYFHNGSARSLEGVVLYYEEFLGFKFSNGERACLVAFLGAL